MKRVLSFLLVFIMVLSLVPSVSAAAEDQTALTGLTVDGLTVTHGKTKIFMYGSFVEHQQPQGSSVDWQASGSQIVAVATTIFNQVGATLTFKNELPTPATLRFEYTFDRDLEEDEYLYEGDYHADVFGLDGSPFERELQPGETYTITVISPSYSDFEPATLTITGLTLSTGGDVTATFAPAQNGSYTVNGSEITAESSFTAPVGTAYELSATAASGYRFFGWYNGLEYKSYNAEASVTVNQNETIYPVFIKDTVAVFGVGQMRFQSLTEADAYASNGAVKTIVLTNDGILSGEHTISAGNTLLIPYNDANSVHTEATSTAIQNDDLWENVDWVKPSAYRTLTMAQGAKITINGSLNVGGRHSSGPFDTSGSPSGNLGMIQMAEGSNITVNNGGTLYCWGYIYGDGSVTAKNGASVHENFQFTDFRGGNATSGIASEFTVFPISQYYVQNIEVSSTFEYGATEYVWGSIYLQSTVFSTSVKFIGTDNTLCMFVPSQNSTVTKTYIPETDRLQIDVNGDGYINPIALELGGTNINTATFALPINSNMTININSGTTALNQSLALLPGVELNIAKGATLSLKGAEPPMIDGKYIHYTGANNLIVYDRDQWLNAYKPIINNNVVLGAQPIDAYFVFGGRRLLPLSYSPTRSYNRTEADLKDAVVDINGNLITEGFIYTTVDVDLISYFGSGVINITGGGAAVTSSKGSGTLVMQNGAGKDAITLQPIQTGTEHEYAYLPMVSARLQNADGSYLDTLAAEPGATYSYCGNCGTWVTNKNTHVIEINWVVDGVSIPQEICVGTRPVFTDGNDPVKEGYTFTGWSTGNDNVPVYTSATLPVATQDAVYFACFEKDAAEGLVGDLDDDGDITADDLTLLARHIAGIERLTGQALNNADVDNSGEVDADDLTNHARYIAGIIKDWPEE